MTGMDQIVWNLTNDNDLFSIWGIASLEEPLKDDLIEKTLKHLIKIIPILNCKPVTNWLVGYWQFLEKENVDDLIERINTKTDSETEEQLKKIFLNPINAKECSMIRVISIDGPSKHYFVIQVHHLVVDGEGVKRICVKFAEIYQELYRDSHWTPPKRIDPCRSWWQIARNFKVRHYGLIVKAYVINIYRLIALFVQKKARYKIAGDTNAEIAQDIQPPYFEGIRIEKESMLLLKAFTKRQRVTVNDILMSSFSLATMKWNKDHGDDREWLGFVYTANLRRWWGEPGGTFANMSAILLYNENYENLHVPSIALARTKSKVDKVKEIIGLDIFLTLLQLKFIPYALLRKLSLGIKEKLYSFISHIHGMTNIGIVFEEAGEFGHTKAIDYSLLAPTFPGGCIIYTITTFKNVTTIYLGSSEDYMTRESANKFLILWKQMILKIISQEE